MNAIEIERSLSKTPRNPPTVQELAQMHSERAREWKRSASGRSAMLFAMEEYETALLLAPGDPTLASELEATRAQLAKHDR